jgi:hypothetical protein
VLQTLKGKVSAVNVTALSDYEATRFADQIAQALGHAGIDVKIWPQRVGIVWTEIYVVIPKPVTDYSKEPLYEAFKNAGSRVGCGDRSHVSLIEMLADVPVIVVGERAGLSYPQIPHVYNLSSKNVSHA